MSDDFYVSVFASTTGDRGKSHQFQYVLPKAVELKEEEGWQVGISEFYHNPVITSSSQDIIKFKKTRMSGEYDLFTFISLILASMRSPAYYSNSKYFNDFSIKKRFPPAFPFVITPKNETFKVASNVTSATANIAYLDVPKPEFFEFEIDKDYTLKQIIRLILQQTYNHIDKKTQRENAEADSAKKPKIFVIEEELEIIEWRLENIYKTFYFEFSAQYKKSLPLLSLTSQPESLYLVIKGDFVQCSSVASRFEPVLYTCSSDTQKNIVQQVSYVKVTKNLITKMNFTITDIFNNPVGFINGNLQCDIYIKLHFKKK